MISEPPKMVITENLKSNINYNHKLILKNIRFTHSVEINLTSKTDKCRRNPTLKG
jgi:hypothetical protein